MLDLELTSLNVRLSAPNFAKRRGTVSEIQRIIIIILVYLNSQQNRCLFLGLGASRLSLTLILSLSRPVPSTFIRLLNAIVPLRPR